MAAPGPGSRRSSSAAHEVATPGACDALQREVEQLRIDTHRQLAELAAFCDVADVTVKTADREAGDVRACVRGLPPLGWRVSAHCVRECHTDASDRCCVH